MLEFASDYSIDIVSSLKPASQQNPAKKPVTEFQYDLKIGHKMVRTDMYLYSNT